jgi:hypothetical protein
MKLEKICKSCGRRMTWRKKWANCWDQVLHCSDACRKTKLGKSADILEATILKILSEKNAGASICPSEVTRSLWPDAWHEHLEETRQAARRLVAENRIEITQANQVVDPSTAKGPIRLRLTH